MSAPAIGPPRHDGDWDRFTSLEGQTFATTPQATRDYIDAVRDHAIARFAVSGDDVLAGALAFPSAQWFGGRAVPAGAVASVCVAPETRGTGLGRAVMDALVAAMREAELAVAPLWPSAVAFYRTLGWELAGSAHRATVPAASLAALRGDGDAVRDPSLDEIAALVERVAPGWSGPLRRPSWWWRWRVPPAARERTVRLGWREGGRLTGFMAYRQDDPAGGGWGFDVVVEAFWAETRHACAGLARIAGGEGPLSPQIAFASGVLPAATPLRLLLGDPGLRPHAHQPWMVRVLDPVAALQEAGWPSHLTGVLSIDAGEGPVGMAFGDGRATRTDADAVRGVRMDAGAFSAWYAGALRATDAATLGRAAGPPEALAFMDALAADRRPWLPDMF